MVTGNCDVIKSFFFLFLFFNPVSVKIDNDRSLYCLLIYSKVQFISKLLNLAAKMK